MEGSRGVEFHRTLLPRKNLGKSHAVERGDRYLPYIIRHKKDIVSEALEIRKSIGTQVDVTDVVAYLVHKITEID
jgi:hypothetical protein